MTLADILSISIYAVMTVATGTLFLRAISAPKLLCNWAASYLAGQLLWLVIFLVATWFSLSVMVLVWVLGSVAIVLCGVIAWREKNDFRGGILALGLVLIICAVSFPQVFQMAFRIPLIEWDARSIWFFHAKALWVDDGISAFFFNNPNYSWWSHTDYPLLLPAQAAVIGFLRGEWSEMAVKGYLFLNFIVYFSLLQRILVHRGWHKIRAWAFAVPVMGISLPAYLNGYADNHYAMPLMLAILLAFQSAPSDGAWALAGLLAAFALNTKNEVVMYLLVGAGLWFIFAKLKHDISFKPIRQSLCGWGIMILGVAPFLLWSIFKVLHGIEGDLHLTSRLLEPISSTVLGLQRAPHILNAMVGGHIQMYSNVIISLIMALYAWLYIYQKKNAVAENVTSLEERLLWSVLLVVHLMIFAVYALTPYDVIWHLKYSANRLLLFPVLLLVALLINAMEKMVLMETDCLDCRQVDKHSS